MAETIIIDALTREITVPESERAFGVAGEHDVTRKHFRVNGRIVDGNDLAVGFAWKVCTENSAKRPNEYPIDSIIADSEGIEFDWLVGMGALTYKGGLKFAVCAKQVNGEGKVQREWHSRIGIGTVYDGIEASAEDIGGFDLRAYIQQTAAEVRQAVQDAASSARASADIATEAAQSATNAATSATTAGGYASAAKQSAAKAAAAAKTASDAAAKVIEEGVAEKIQQMESIQTDVTAKQQATNTAAATATAARDAAQAAQKGAEAARDTAAKSAEAAAKSEANAKQSADTLTESMENVVANTAAVAELKEKKAEIDDTAVGANAWSSKHIIDMLCPEIKESGNPVLCYPVAGYPLGVKASWEPVQEGSGTPSPENIRPIKGRDSVTVERCGENILNPKAYASVTTNGITFTVNDDKSVHIIGTATGRAVFKLYSYRYKTSLPDGKYTFSTIANVPSGAGILIGCYYKSGPKAIYKKNLITLGSGSSSTTVSLYGVEWLDGYIDVASGSTVDTTLYPMLVLGTTAPTTYTPYNGQTNTLTLPETVYGGEVDAVRGEGQKTWKMLTLDGMENWILWSNTDFYAYYIAVSDILDETILCDRYVYKNVGGPAAAGQNTIIVQKRPSGVSYMCIRATDKEQSVSEWKSYLAAQYAAGTPVQVCYKLAEPTPFTSTGAQAIPALAGANTVLTDADSATVTGRADPIKRITDLEAAVASIN